MLQVSAHGAIAKFQEIGSREDSGAASFADLLFFWRLRARFVLAWTLALVTAAALWLAVAPTEYAASSEILLSPAAGSLEGVREPRGTLDATEIESRVQMAKSELILRRAFETLGLDKDAAGEPAAPGAFDGLLSVFRNLRATDAGADVVWRRQQAFADFAERVSARRVGQSRILEIGFRAHDPKLAVRATNALALSFIRDEIISSHPEVSAGGEWLRSRVAQYNADIAKIDDAGASASEPTSAPSAATARIITFAHEPVSKSFPKIGLTLAFSLFFGLFTGLAGVAISQGFDDRVRSASALKRRYSDLVVLEAPARAPAQTALSDLKQPPRLVARSASALILDAPARSQQRLAIGVISLEKNPERTRIAAEIARAFAASGQDVVFFAYDPALSDPSGGARAEKIPRAAPREIAPHFSVSSLFGGWGPGGGDDAVDFSVRSTIEDAKARATVIVDLPSIDQFPETGVLLKHTEGVFVAVSRDISRFADLSALFDRLGQSNVPVVAAILVAIEKPRNPWFGWTEGGSSWIKRRRIHFERR